MKDWKKMMPGLATVFIATPLFAQTVSGTPARGPNDECFPQCRQGYFCNKGQCVSACNPACAANETCTATGECAPRVPRIEEG